MGLMVNHPSTKNADRLKAAIPLVIKVAAQPHNNNK
jgi:hypothetical protein